MAKFHKAIFKWPGGKFRVLATLLPLLSSGKRLVEPFVGSGVVFLNASHRRCLLADVNPDIISFYRELVERGREFITCCRRLFGLAGNQTDAYYNRRNEFNNLPLGQKRAALFLYLNRHCYNGMVRYNATGKFNVPFGRYLNPYFPEVEMLAFLERMRSAEIEFMVGDFRTTFKQVKKGDIVYCDPPYIPLSATANFTTYSGTGFGMADQMELATLLEKSVKRGAAAVISNHDSAQTRMLYKGARELFAIDVQRMISRNGNGRLKVGEVLAVYR